MSNQIVNVATQFSRYPAGRYKEDGPYSGAAFREKFLVPFLKANEHIVVELDGVRGYGSSFLEEAFGGLIREGFTPEKVLSQIELVSEDNSLIEEINDYIRTGGIPEIDEF